MRSRLSAEAGLAVISEDLLALDTDRRMQTYVRPCVNAVQNGTHKSVL